VKVRGTKTTYISLNLPPDTRNRKLVYANEGQWNKPISIRSQLVGNFVQSKQRPKTHKRAFVSWSRHRGENEKTEEKKVVKIKKKTHNTRAC
jgi:hypothetical protein